MTATIKPPDSKENRESIRISWMETLGFSEASHLWSDQPLAVTQNVMTHSPDAPTVADWQPQEVGSQFQDKRVRWGLVTTLTLVVAALTYGGFWFYQRPAADAVAASTAVTTEASNLDSLLPDLESANNALVDGTVDSRTLVAVDETARALFNTSSDLVNQPEARSAAAQAASMALDAVRLISDANAYAIAVTPMLIAPVLETVPGLIELDEAARAFGEWQLRFDTVRAALPDGVLTQVTTRLDVFSGNLSIQMESYVDALRLDDAGAAAAVLGDIENQLQTIGVEMESAIVDVQVRAGERIETSKAALQQLLG